METTSLGRRESSERHARFLGYFSLALGVSQLAAPGSVAELIGLRDRPRTRGLMRLLGLREVASGLAVLAKPGSAGPLWLRTLGDAMDLGLLGAALNDGAPDRSRLVAATAAVAGVAAADAYSAARLSRSPLVQKVVEPVHVVRSIIINRPPETVYHFWRDLENLPRFMAHLESVKNAGQTSTWRAKGPAGTTVEWEAEVTLDEPNERIAWRSLEGATVPNRGAVCFKPGPGGRGTIVIVELKYEPPGGALGRAIAQLFGEEPGQQIAGDLRRLKQVLETGSVVHSDASIHRGMHPARPAAESETVTVIGRSDSL
ncbi:MAG: cyclase [Myxococcales bacterium]|nr:MAG: cyclase [Myxococcales bacterium]